MRSEGFESCAADRAIIPNIRLTGTHEKEAVFHLFFRKAPFQSGYTIAAGLGDAIAWLRDSRFSDADLAYLGTLTGNDGAPLFDPAFLAYLRTFTFTCEVDAIPEGTVVFPNEPLLRIRGPILQAQIVETALLNFINFQTLIATKAARICHTSKEGDAARVTLRTIDEGRCAQMFHVGP